MFVVVTTGRGEEERHADVVVVVVKTEPVRINRCWFLLVLLQDGAGTQFSVCSVWNETDS